jgi:hypothetical protein
MNDNTKEVIETVIEAIVIIAICVVLPIVLLRC